MRIVLVTRASCHLCDDALALLHDLGVHPELADVDSDDRLFDLYDWRVPVVLVDDVVVAEGVITKQALARVLGRSGREAGEA